MKKKSPRGIPDFGSKKPSKLPFTKTPQGPAPRQAFDGPKVKPPSTSSKGGRRGS